MASNFNIFDIAIDREHSWAPRATRLAPTLPVLTHPSIYPHLPPAFSSGHPGRDAHHFPPSCSPDPQPRPEEVSQPPHTFPKKLVLYVAFSYAPRALVHFSGLSRCSPQPHAHTRRRLESALTSSQVGAGVASLSRPEFITCAQPN